MNRSSGALAGRSWSGWLWLPLCPALLLGLAGCNANPGEIAASTTAATHVAARPGVSPRGAPVALTSVEGAPAQIAQRFADQTRDQAAGLDVVLTDARDAKYLVRGYLSAEPTSGGAVVSYVLDVFDARKSRVQRVEDAVPVKGSGGDPWSGLDDKAMAELASKSAADLAAILSNMPEAVAAAQVASTAPSSRSAPTSGASGRVAAAAFQ
jgi:hypothetical protein